MEFFKMAKTGRPTKYTKEVLSDLVKRFDKYIESNTIPIIAEFAYTNNIPRQKLYEFPEFNDTIKRCIDKKETNLEKGVLSGKLNASMGIFSLKQLGWRDRQEIDHTTKGESINKIEVVVKGSKSNLLDKE